MVKKWFWGQKLSFLRDSAIMALNTHFWAKYHFFTITTHKPAYIYPNNFSRENFWRKKIGPLGPPWGTWGPYLRIPSIEYFPNVFFWTSIAPLASPYLQILWEPQKKPWKFSERRMKYFSFITIPNHGRSAWWWNDTQLLRNQLPFGWGQGNRRYDQGSARGVRHER